MVCATILSAAIMPKPVTAPRRIPGGLGVGEHLPHVKLILRHIHRTILRDNVALVATTAILGALNRLFALLGMALTFKAIITALAPEATLGRVNALLSAFGMEIDANALLLLIAAAVFGAYLGSWLCQLLRDRCLGRLVWTVLKRQEYLARQRTLEEDLFLIEDMSPHVQTVTRILEIVAFSAIFLGVIGVFAAKLLLALLPLLLMFVFFLLHYERSRLGRRHRQKESQAAYVNQRGLDGVSRRREHAADGVERDEYIMAREAVRDSTAGTARNATLISGIIMVLITLYVGTLDIEIGDFPFIPLFIVVSIRTLVAYSQQLGRSITQILELRGKLRHLRASEATTDSGTRERANAPRGNSQ